MNFQIVYKNIYTWIYDKISQRNYEKLSKHKFFLMTIISKILWIIHSHFIKTFCLPTLFLSLQVLSNKEG